MTRALPAQTSTQICSLRTYETHRHRTDPDLPSAAHADGGALAAIKSNGVIRLGHPQDSPPFSFIEGGTPQGYSVELCKHVAQSIQQQLKLSSLRIQWVPLGLQERIPAVRDRKVDIECGTTTWTLSRQQEVDFSLMTFVDGATVLVRGNSDLMRLADLNGKKVAVPTTTTAPARCRRR
jgi:ABC-type amino acid transport substrate-binding protein